MTTQEEKMQDLIYIGFVRFKDDVPIRSYHLLIFNEISFLNNKNWDISEEWRKNYFRTVITDENLEKLTNFKAGENCVMIAGYPKSGSHFLLQILNELGYARLYGETDGLDTVNPLPFEFQKLGALKTMEKIVNENSEKKFVLNHTHAYPQFLPAKKVKTIFITRDPRAVAVSAWHFFASMEKYRPEIECHKIKDIDDFAQKVFEGKFSYGDVQIYNKTWRDFARTYPESRIHFVSFEDLKLHTEEEISKIAKFLEHPGSDIQKVVENSAFESSDPFFKTMAEKGDSQQDRWNGSHGKYIKSKSFFLEMFVNFRSEWNFSLFSLI